MDAPAQRRRTVPQQVLARLAAPVTLAVGDDGSAVACVADQSIPLGMLSREAAARAAALAARGLQVVRRRGPVEGELAALLQRLARRGFLEYGVARDRRDEHAVIEPQTPFYWPQEVELESSDTVALSRFALLRRRGSDFVLESPRADALFRLRDPGIAGMLARLAEPQRISRLRYHAGFCGTTLLGLLVQSGILFTVAEGDDGGRATEGGGEMALWDFHDLLFHARSTAGRHANPLGGVYRYAGLVGPLPAVRPPWPGKPIDLDAVTGPAAPPPVSALSALLRERRSTRDFDAAHPVTLAELARFLETTARVLWRSAPGEDGSEIAPRPYPSAGSSYELELYVAVHQCDGLGRGFYHYDAGDHALAPVGARDPDLQMLFGEALYATAAEAFPQIVIVIAARFGRVSWKYASLAYSLVLKNAGVLLQNFYLTATQMGLGGCATGICNVELFARMTGLDFEVEGPVGEFMLGRPMPKFGGDARGDHDPGDGGAPTA